MSEINSIERQVLELIEQHNGKWYWYHIDRQISRHGEIVGPFNKELKHLKDLGYYEEILGDNAIKPTYWITDKGRSVLKVEKKED